MIGTYTNSITIILLTVGGASLSIYLQTLFESFRKVNFVFIYAILLIVISLYSLIYITPVNLIRFNPINIGVSVILGLVAGYVATWLDRVIIRQSNRLLIEELRSRKKNIQESNTTNSSVVWNMKSNNSRPHLIPLLVVGGLEEYMFRGVLVSMCIYSSNNEIMFYALIIALTVIFSLMHIQMGWTNVLSKTPLGILTVVLVLSTGSLIAPIIAHCFFNWKVWLELKDQVSHKTIVR
jgi:membrane protease YdiL (CAAX protease family)